MELSTLSHWKILRNKYNYLTYGAYNQLKQKIIPSSRLFIRACIDSFEYCNYFGFCFLSLVK